MLKILAACDSSKSKFNAILKIKIDLAAITFAQVKTMTKSTMFAANRSNRGAGFLD